MRYSGTFMTPCVHSWTPWRGQLRKISVGRLQGLFDWINSSLGTCPLCNVTHGDGIVYRAGTLSVQDQESGRGPVGSGTPLTWALNYNPHPAPGSTTATLLHPRPEPRSRAPSSTRPWDNGPYLLSRLSRGRTSGIYLRPTLPLYTFL